MAKICYLIFIAEGKRWIDSSCLRDVETKINDHTGEKLFFVLQTSGGDPFPAVAIMNLLRRKFQKIYTLIPNYAKSAGTLMSLGTDIIYMDDKSALGPLDLPMEHPKDGSMISALDLQNTITTLSALSETITKSRYKLLRGDKIKLSRPDAAKLSLQIATKFIEPIVRQIDPYHLQKSYRELKIALYYAIDLLSSAMMKDNFIKALKTARKLVNDYPAHEYSIFSKEAKNVLNLTVKDLEPLKEWKLIKEDFEECNKSYRSIKYIEKNDTTKKTAKRKR